MDKNPFDNLSKQYDSWFDSSDGKPIFELEVNCLKKLISEVKGRWLEIGVGSGRFAKALMIKEGIDPSTEMLEIASKRGIDIKIGVGENLPYSDNSFDGLLMVVTVCFLENPDKAFQECYRVLKNDGHLVVGLVPAKSAWGKLYAEKSKEGHRFYSIANFYTCQQIIQLAQNCNLTFISARSCLFDVPGSFIENREIKDEINENAGFVAMMFKKSTS